MEKSAKKKAQQAGGSAKKCLDLVNDMEEYECAKEVEIMVEKPAAEVDQTNIPFPEVEQQVYMDFLHFICTIEVTMKYIA